MSTTFYRLQPPIAFLRVLDRNPKHASPGVVRQFAGEEVGHRNSTSVTWSKEVNSTECLISEYGDLTSRSTLVARMDAALTRRG